MSFPARHQLKSIIFRSRPYYILGVVISVRVLDQIDFPKFWRSYNKSQKSFSLPFRNLVESWFSPLKVKMLTKADFKWTLGFFSLTPNWWSSRSCWEGTGVKWRAGKFPSGDELDLKWLKSYMLVKLSSFHSVLWSTWDVETFDFLAKSHMMRMRNWDIVPIAHLHFRPLYGQHHCVLDLWCSKGTQHESLQWTHQT